MVSFPRVLQWRHVASVRPPYRAARIRKGLCYTVKLTFALDLDQVSRSLYLLETPHSSLITFRYRIAPQDDDVTERLARVAVIVPTKELGECACLGEISIYTEAGQFGYMYSRQLRQCIIFTP